MSVPKIPASSAKLFTRKRTRRQVVVDPSATAVDKPSISDTIPVKAPEPSKDAAAVVVPEAPVFRRR